MTRTAVVGIDELGRDDLPLAGGKGANLGELVRAGFDVPPGFVVTTAAHDEVVGPIAADIAALADAGDAAGIRALVSSRTVPPGLAAAITTALDALGGGPVAVRSSATAEDLPGASFAGQQDTYLGVEGADAVIAAVRDCWASLWTDRALAYRAHQGHAGRLSMAVVVQRLVDAEAAGVLFTANPVNGRRDESVVTAAWGLGESVVSGRVVPDEFVVGPDGVRARIGTKDVMTVRTSGGAHDAPTPAARRSEPTLGDARARELAGVGRRIAGHFGVPQDIEWALEGGRFWIVQARPITALPEPSGPVPTQWPVPRPGSLYVRASITEQLPDPLSPLFAGLVATAVPEGLNRLIGELSPRTPGLDVAFPTINGYAFYDYSRAAWNQMWSFTPAALRMVTIRGFVHDRWRDRELPRYRCAVAAWADRDPAALSAVELLAGVRELVDAACLYYTTVQSVIPVASSAELIWSGLHDRLLRRAGGPAASDFLVGFDSEPLRAEQSLFDLATWCRGQPGLPDALAAGATPEDPSAPVGVSGQTWRDFTERFADHLRGHGHLLYNLDLVQPVPADDPAPVLAGLRYAVDGTVADPRARQREQARTRARITSELMARLDPARRRLATPALALAQRWGPIREDALAAMGLGWPTARRLVRELGRRLTDAGALETADDAHWLTPAEVGALASDLDAGRPVASRAADVAARRETWRGQARATPPQYLPRGGALRWMESMMPAREGDGGPVLAGTTGTGGRVTARARVVRGPEDFAAFEPGEVLVASITTPAYTPLFARAAAVVTDIGGVLSHGSIVAREYGIPAVLGTGSATRRIATGDMVTVDGPGAAVRLADAPDPVEIGRPRWPLAVAGGVAVGVGVLAWRRLAITCRP